MKLSSSQFKKLIRFVLKEYDGKHNQVGSSSQCSGYSHDVTIPDVTAMVRDPLNDPELNGKMNEGKNKDYETKNFVIKFKEIKGIPCGDNIGKVFFKGPLPNKGIKLVNGMEYFCNAVFHKEGLGLKNFDNRWRINQGPGAWRLRLSDTPQVGEKPYFSVEELMDTLQGWYEIKNKSNQLKEGYRFEDFKWLAKNNGFEIPTNVFNGSILLGVIVSEPDGYVIKLIKGPHGDIAINSSPRNKFKTKDEAAETVHKVWKSYRHGDEIERL